MLSKLAIALSAILLMARGVMAAEACPPDCPVKGGGTAATDCLIEFDGVAPLEDGSRVIECADGDPTCDHDPTPGVCGFELTACLNNADPSLPTCTATGIDRVTVRGGGEDGRSLAQAVEALLPTSQNTCTTPVQFHVPIIASGYDDDSPELGTRRFSLSSKSSFAINGQPFTTFAGYIDLHGGKVDPKSGLALVDVSGSSTYIQGFIQFGGGLALCLKPVTPNPMAGVIACGSRKPGGRAVRVVARGAAGSDRDGLLLVCRSEVNYSTSVAIDRNIGVVGENGFTAEDCAAAHGTVNEDNGWCISSFITGQLENERSSRPGEMILAPFGGLNGFGVEITQESALPCGDEEPSSGQSVAIALTTARSRGSVIDANNSEGDVLDYDVVGEPFSCENFSVENGPGILSFAAPQLGLPLLGDGVTQFTFVDK